VERWRRRIGLIAAGVCVTTCLIVLAGITWAVLWIRKDRSGLVPVTGEITKVVASRRSGARFSFGRYSLNVRYRASDGRFAQNSVEKTTYWFPSAGDHIGLLIDKKRGVVEASPFPELWIVLAMAYAFLGGIIYMVVKVSLFVIQS